MKPWGGFSFNGASGTHLRREDEGYGGPDQIRTGNRPVMSGQLCR